MTKQEQIARIIAPNQWRLWEAVAGTQAIGWRADMIAPSMEQARLILAVLEIEDADSGVES